eukprot:COSAG02_NODE_818_length_16813_cov_137.642874_13_plen_100_part_00
MSRTTNTVLLSNNYSRARGAPTGGARARASREAAHDGPVTNPLSNRTVVCGLAAGRAGLCCWCTSVDNGHKALQGYNAYDTFADTSIQDTLAGVGLTVY